MHHIARAALTAVVGAVALACAAPAYADWPRPLHYDATLAFVDRTHALSGTQRITFVNDSPEAVGALWLRVWPNGYGSCKRPNARVTAIEGATTGRWAVRCTALRVRLAAPVAPGEQGTVALRLRIRVPAKTDRFGRERGATYMGNVLPLLAPGPRLDPYTQLGDPFYSLDASWSVALDVPRGLSAATTGSVQRREGQTLSIVAEHARDFAIVVGPFAVDSVTSASGITLNRYRLRSAPRGRSLKTLSVARKAVDRFSEWFGPPPENEVDIAPGPGGIAMEFPGLVMTPDLNHPVVHELAHQWWYSLVGDDQWRSPWLDESFAEYATWRLPESVMRSGKLRCNLERPHGRFRGALDASMDAWERDGGRSYGRVVYHGGACALRSLERDLGAAWMTSFLRSYVDAHRNGVTTTHDFVTALREAAPAPYDVEAFLRRARIKGR